MQDDEEKQGLLNENGEKPRGHNVHKRSKRKYQRKRCIWFSMKWKGRKVVNDFPFCLFSLIAFIPIVSAFMLAAILSFISAVWLFTIPSLTSHSPCLVSLILFLTAGFVGFCVKASNFSPVKEVVDEATGDVVDNEEDRQTSNSNTSDTTLAIVPQSWRSSVGTWFFLIAVVVLFGVVSYVLMWIGLQFFWDSIPGKIYVVSFNILLGGIVLWPAVDRLMTCLAQHAWKRPYEPEAEEELQAYCRDECLYCCC